MSNVAGVGAAGFTLIEAIVAMAILTVGLLGLAQAFYLGMRHTATSSANLIAREKAREAVESVHTARDTRTITWAQIRNVSNGGVFLDGAQDLPGAGRRRPGQHGRRRGGALEALRDPGPNGVLGDADDIVTPLVGFQRQIQILELTPVNPDLREVRVTITFRVGAQRGTLHAAHVHLGVLLGAMSMSTPDSAAPAAAPASPWSNWWSRWRSSSSSWAGRMSALTNAYRANESARSVIDVNNNLRIGVDLVVRDFIQVGQGLPTGRVVQVPNGNGRAADPAAAPAGQRVHRVAGRDDGDSGGDARARAAVRRSTASATDMVTTLAVDSMLDARRRSTATTSARTPPRSPRPPRRPAASTSAPARATTSASAT